MAKYSIIYIDPVGAPGKPLEHVLEALSDAQARIRFMNLSWVAFTAISITSIALKGDQPEAAKKKAKEDPLAGLLAHAYRGIGGPCRECGQAVGHKLHHGFEVITDEPEDRTNERGKRGAAAVKAAAAGLQSGEERETAEIVSNLTRKHRQDSASIPARATQPPGYDWRAEVARLTTRIGTYADEAQAATRKGDHDEADRLRAKAKEDAATRDAITKRNKGK